MECSYKICRLSNPEVNACVYAESTAGSFTTGAKTVPLKNPVILKGGVHSTTGNALGELTFIAPTDGVTLSKTTQPVPGGLTGIVAPSWWPQFLRDLFNETINNGLTGVQATVELNGSASSVKLSVLNTLTGSGTALGMPVKIKLSNPFLGNSCYIGSSSNPIQLNLVTGTTSPPPPNTPISGSPGTIEPIDGGNIIALKGNRLVDNSYAAPGRERVWRTLLLPHRSVRQLNRRRSFSGWHQYGHPRRYELRGRRQRGSRAPVAPGNHAS